MVKRSNEQTLGEIIKEVIKAHGLEDKITRVRVSEAWYKVMGKFIAGKTASISFQNNTLFVKLDSPALCNELSYAKEKIIKSINKELGKNEVKKIVIR